MRINNFSSGFLAVSIALAGTITVAPARADILGSLEWNDGTSNFNRAATNVFRANFDDAFPSSPNSFNVTFSPASLGGKASVFIATGDFEPFFDTPQFVNVNGGSGTTGTFQIANPAVRPPTPTPDPGVELAAEFTLKNALTFELDTSPEPTPVVATLPAGSRFLGQLGDDGDVTFSLISGRWGFQLPDGSSGLATESVFAFGNTGATVGGTFAAQGETVPEPMTILGSVVALACGTVLKRQQNKKNR